MCNIRVSLRNIVFLTITWLFLTSCSIKKTGNTPILQPIIPMSPTATEKPLKNNTNTKVTTFPVITNTSESTIPSRTYSYTQPLPTETLKSILQPTLTPTHLITMTSLGKPTPTATIPSSSEMKAPGQIAFANWGINEDGIDIINVDGTGYRRVASDKVPSRWLDYPAWSPDGLWIVFSKADFPGPLQLFLIKTDGSHLHQLTYSDDEGHKINPSWSPDGQRIVYSVRFEGHDDIYIINRDGTGKEILVDTPLVESSPTWSPDGQMIAYLVSQSEYSPYVPIESIRQDLYIINPDGKGNRFVFRNATWGSRLTWSPDSKRIVFQSYDDCSLYIINVDGSGLRRLTITGLNARDPTWSPDGRYIAFDASYDACFPKSAGKGTNRQIYVIGVEGNGLEQITSNPDWAPLSPAWSPVPHLQIDGSYFITPAGSDLNLRKSTSLNARVLQKLKVGDTVMILEGPVYADYYYWWRLRTSDGVEGWAVDVLGWYAPVNVTATPTPIPTP